MSLLNYIKTVWANGTTPAINATNLNHIENGIKAVSDAFDNQLQQKSVGTAAGDIAYYDAGGKIPSGNLPIQFAIGSYTGDGTTNRQITVGFQPKLVIIRSNFNGSIVRITPTIVLAEYVNGNTISSTQIIGTTADKASSGVSITATGYVTGTTASDFNSLNGNNVTYWWEAWS